MNEKLETIEADREPEYVGAHSALSAAACQDIHDANSPGEEFAPERCANDATHTVVMFAGSELKEIAMCDSCGEPQDVDRYERKWTGELYGDGENR